MSSINIEVTVCIITFNQISFIKDCIDSVIKQKTVFPYEILIGDDLSIDGTIEVLKEYEKQYPNQIKLLLNPVNVGGTRNFANVISCAKGKYIALLEGDDYWTNENKLQIQYDFMENHPNLSTVFHEVKMIDRNNELIANLPKTDFKKDEYNLKDLIIYDSFMPTCSILFRNNLFKYFPDEFYSSRNMCDWPLNVLNAEIGNIGYIDKSMAVYRSSSSDTAWSSQRLKNILESAINVNHIFNKYFNYKYTDLFEKKITNYKLQITLDLFRHSEIKNGFLYYKLHFVDGKSYLNLLLLINFKFLKSIIIGLIKLILKK